MSKVSSNLGKNANFSQFLEFLSLIPSNQKNYDNFFKLEHFAFWFDKYEDLNLKVSILNSNDYSLSCNIPDSELWIEVFNGYSKENLLEEIFKYGLEKVQKILNEHCLLRKVQDDQKMSVEEFESKRDLSLFCLEHSIVKLFSIWQYKKTSVETVSRIGKDNRIETECFIKYLVVIGNEIIDDDYLKSLLPKERTTYDTDYGFVASHSKNTTEQVIKDLAIHKLFTEKYNDVLHFNYLTKNGRKIKQKDSSYYKTAN
jgi:hypothetical protein